MLGVRETLESECVLLNGAEVNVRAKVRLRYIIYFFQYVHHFYIKGGEDYCEIEQSFFLW